MIKITRDNITEYLLANNLVDVGEEFSIEPIGGFWGGMGVSSTLIRVIGTTNRFVLKQPLAELAVKDYWPCETNRIKNEKNCIEALAILIGPEQVPKILFFDSENDILVMELITTDWQLWKTQLLDGITDDTVGRKAGELIATIHNKTYHSESIQEQFSDVSIFRQLRIDPYYKTTAERNPDIAETIEMELQRVLNSRSCLVLGDFSPKNIFTRDGAIILLDHEIAHYGDPTVDFSFCLNHLLLKYVHLSLLLGEIQSRYLQVARTYCRAYIDTVEFCDASTMNRLAIPNLGCFMLARIDGKSPVEYITSEHARAVVRQISKNILRSEYGTLGEVFDMIGDKLRVALGAGA